MARAAGLALTCAIAGVIALHALATPARAQGDSAKRAALGDPAMRGTTGTLSGTVSSTGGRPIEGADVVVRGTALHMRTGPDGKFTLRDVREGDHSVMVRRPGFQPAEFSVQVEPGTDVFVQVTLQVALRVLDTVTVAEETFNQLSGLVTDAHDQPLEGVEVQVAGTTLTLTTRAGGGFLFLDVAPGKYLLRLRKPGYRVRVQGVEMLRRINRNLTVRLTALAPGVAPAEAARLGGFGSGAEAVQADFTARRTLAGSQAILMTGDELAAIGAVPLSTALQRKLVGAARELSGARCVLVDGASAQLNAGEKPDAARATLQAIGADQVELLELYPPGAEKSATACARFPPAIGECGCGVARPPAIAVVWLKR